MVAKNREGAHPPRPSLNPPLPSFTLNDVTIEIPIHDESYSVSHVDTPSTEYNLQTPNNSLIASTRPETQELITNMVNHFSFTEVTSPEDQSQSLSLPSFRTYCVSSTIAYSTWKRVIEKEAKVINFKNIIISDLTKIISKIIKAELKIFKLESPKHLSESLTWYKKTNKRAERRM